MIYALLISLVLNIALGWVLYDQWRIIRRQASMIVKLDAMCDALSPMPKLGCIPRKNLMFGLESEIAEKLSRGEWD